jgi:hypothetical protein
LAVHPNHDLAMRALSRVDDDLCRRVTNSVPSTRFEAKAYKPRGVDLVIPCVLDHGASPPRRKHRGEARIPRSDDVAPGGDAAAAVPPAAQTDLADPNRYVRYHELAALEQRLQVQLQTMETNIQNNMATMIATMQTNILATMNANMATMQTDIAALLRHNGLTP